MLLLPYEHFIIITRLTTEEVTRKLRQIVGPEPAYTIFNPRPNTGKEFSGEISDGKFKMHRNISYRNSFRPEIKGTISKDYNGTKIEIRMTLHIIVIIFLVVFLGFTGPLALAILPAMMNAVKSHNFSYQNFIPAIMFVFACIITIGGFKAESLRSKKFIKNFFDDENPMNKY